MQYPRHPSRVAFTLVELLVVIGVIAVLIGILLTSLRNARDSATRTQCLSNLRAVGIGLAAYIADNRGSYPYHEFWYNHIGPKGNTARFGLGAFPETDRTGLRTDTNILVERPLNAYVGQNPSIAACPADMGDAKKPGVTSCFEAYGTSYQIQWNDPTTTTASYGVIPVTGGATLNPAGGRIINPARPAAKLGKYIVFNKVQYSGDWSRKIVMGDFNWHGNRPITDGRVLWHRPGKRDVRQQNMLFADGHAEFFAFPKNYGSFFLPVDAATNGFW